MPLDFKRDHDSGFATTVVRQWNLGGHQVAMVRHTDTNPDRNLPECTYIVCECDHDIEDVVEDGKVVAYMHRRDSHNCAFKKSVHKEVMAESGGILKMMLA